MRDFQETAVCTSPAGSAADGAPDRPIPCAMQSFDAVEPLAELEASWERYTSSVAGLAIVDLPGAELAVIAVGLEFGLAVMPEFVLGVGLGVGPAVLTVLIVVAVVIQVALVVVAVAVARAEAVAVAVGLVVGAVLVAVAVAGPVAVFVVVVVIVHVGTVEVVAVHFVGYVDVPVVLALEAVAPVLECDVALPAVGSLVERMIADADYMFDDIVVMLVPWVVVVVEVLSSTRLVLLMSP